MSLFYYVLWCCCQTNSWLTHEGMLWHGKVRPKKTMAAMTDVLAFSRGSPKHRGRELIGSHEATKKRGDLPPPKKWDIFFFSHPFFGKALNNSPPLFPILPPSLKIEPTYDQRIRPAWGVADLNRWHVGSAFFPAIRGVDLVPPQQRWRDCAISVGHFWNSRVVRSKVVGVTVGLVGWVFGSYTVLRCEQFNPSLHLL